MCNLPFNIVSHKEFQNAFRLLRDGLKIPKRTSLRDLLNSRFKEVSSNLFQGISSQTRIALSIDCWTSPWNNSFVAILATYITYDWKYKQELIGFEESNFSHTGNNLARLAYNRVRSFNIHNRISAITMDNASNNRALQDTFKQLVAAEQDTSSTFQVFRVHCMAHVIQLAVKAFLQTLRVEAFNNAQDNDHWDNDLVNINSEDTTGFSVYAKVYYTNK